MNTKDESMGAFVFKFTATGMILLALGFLIWCLIPKPPAILIGSDKNFFCHAADGYIMSYDVSYRGTNERPDIVTDNEALEMVIKPRARNDIREEVGQIMCMDIFTNGQNWQDAKKRLADKGIYIVKVNIDPDSVKRIEALKRVATAREMAVLATIEAREALVRAKEAAAKGNKQ